MTDERWGCYVHVPWCRVRCPYCAFYVVTGDETPAWRGFVRAVHAEYAERHPRYPGPASTVYVGGGTPSRLAHEALGGLLGGIERQAGAEITVEANPEDVTDAWLAGALAAGFNRVSLGVQTVNLALSRRLGRAHTREQAHTAMQRLARSGLTSWSADLIFAVPGQTVTDLDVDLSTLLDAGAPHVSVYGLTLEPDTPFARAHARGAFPPLDDELWRALYDRLVMRLLDAGLARYEVSNFARPGHRAVHNALYWQGAPYLGLGPSAHSFGPDGHRRVNASDLGAYVASPGHPPHVEELPTPEQAAIDHLVAGMRGVNGIERGQLRARTGHDLSEDTVQQLVRGGLVHADDDRVALTHQGMPLADGVIRRLVDGLRASAPPHANP